ncbi:endolytic transglycosylase MltG [Saccharibacillus sp. CPCC 101409]|uniref:endolytic transglycosylase MltG n=1 Tax=Saccharibacillus sp. CPCC 101409 TaxID=3058041 RepID=UPI00267122BE|nr:endolytic transglycosylase MltG [Saccharibacillus sp. CPCC 101409]MDO3409036.1 endolytic transglycosylase MltG [Saccharibacillus sp. CPCC 101409]
MNKNKRAARGLLVGLLILLLLAASAAAFVYISLRPVPASDQPVAFKVAEGTGTAEIADGLEQEGLIRSALLYKIYLKLENEGSSFRPGKHEILPGSDYAAITAVLNGGEGMQRKSVKVTIPEGFTIKQIADRLHEAGGWDAKTIRQLARQPEKFADVLPGEIPDDPKPTYALEGYLFPDTYEFEPDATEEDVVRRLVQETSGKLKSIPDFDNLLKRRGLTVHQLLTVASLVEREAVVDSERALIAGVIDNRLNDPMKLQIDATVQYALGEQKERLLYSDLEIDSPYNTYKYEGLPPGPIASPSLKSIEAALRPEKSDYFFYVTKKDGSGEHLFAETYAQHEQNIEQSKAGGE